MKTKQLTKPRTRRVPESIYLINDGEFQGTLEGCREVLRPQDGAFTELSLVERAKREGFKLRKTLKRSRKFVTVTLHDPQKPACMKFLRRRYGLRKGQKERSVEYTNSDGTTFRLWFQFDRDSRAKFDKDAPQCHKHELEMRLLNLLVKTINGEEELD